MTITSPHNEKLKEIRKLGQRRRWRERSARFVAEGEDLVAAAAAAGWNPVHLLAAAGSGLEGDEVEDALLAGARAVPRRRQRAPRDRGRARATRRSLGPRLGHPHPGRL